MRWQDAERSTNVDDVRGRRFGGGGMPIRLGGVGGMSLGGLVAIMAITYLLGGDPLAVLTGGAPTETAAPGPGDTAPIDDEGSQFVKTMLKSTETVWGSVFREQLGRSYAEPRLVMFTDVGPVGLRHQLVGGRALLLSARPARLHRHLLLQRARSPLRRARRLRPGLRHRARGRPSRPEPARHRREGPRRAAARQRGPGQPALGPHGAAGRLLRRRLGPLRQGAERARQGDPRAGRRRGRPARGRRHRRRRDPAQDAGPGDRPRAGRTARRSSACSGCAAASTAARSAPATPSARSLFAARSTRARGPP